MGGSIIAEFVISSLIDHVYILGSNVGLYAWNGNDAQIESALLIVAKLAAAAAVAAFVLNRSHESWRSLGHFRFSPFVLGLAFVPVIAGVVVFLSEIDNLLRAYLPAGAAEHWDFAPELGPLIGASWFGPILAVVVAPLAEETLFRGLILRGLLGRWKPWTAIVTSALLFALMHFNPAQTPVALGLGLVLGWVYYRTRSLGLCMLGHALNNASSFPVEFLPLEIPGLNAESNPPSSVAVSRPWCL